MPNNALAERIGIAPSTCLGRVRSLRERGVIRGSHADVDQAALGRPLQAMIAVRLQSHARGHIRGFVAGVAHLPEVLNVFFLAGKDDFLLHVAAASTATLRDFVESLSSNADVSYTETSLIFEHIRADVAGRSPRVCTLGVSPGPGPMSRGTKARRGLLCVGMLARRLGTGDH